MKTGGFDELSKEVEDWAVERELQLTQRVNALLEALVGWARDEHPWKNRTGDLGRSIHAFVTEATPTHIHAELYAREYYSVFLELARDGKWAWLWPVVVNHREDMIRILDGGAVGVSLVKNPDVDAEYESYKAAARK